ncbi:MAG: metallophosphoesterase family protein [Myxococcales bacterium]|nr:metallophosphoesterase family protein [Myxococcales bacterium]
MRIAILSDVHSNLEALQATLEYCRQARIHQYICLGDVVGYGADPNPCCDLIREVAAVTLLGNHDAAVVGVMDTDYYYEAARDVLYWTRETLSAENFRWLYSLPYTFRHENLAFFHSAPIMPSGFYYVVSTSDAEKHLRVFNRLHEYNFVGHSHLTNRYLLSTNTVKDAGKMDIRRYEDWKWIINVGSVGQPRDRDSRACFGIFDTGNQTFQHIRVPYDIEKTATKIRSSGLDEKFARRLFAGV